MMETDATATATAPAGQKSLKDRGSGISPIRFSPILISPMAKVHCTFANTTPGVSPIDESTVDFCQFRCELNVD